MTSTTSETNIVRASEWSPDDLRERYPGIVVPTFFALPDWAYTNGPVVARLNERMGYTPDPEQRLLLDVAFAVDEYGYPAASSMAIIAPRQNLKTGFCKQSLNGWLGVAQDVEKIVWSAHEMATIDDAFDEIVSFYEHDDSSDEPAPPLAAHTLKTIHGNGKASIRMKRGAYVRFRTRTKNGGRGLASDRLILDEAMALQAAQVGALVPTMSARPGSQMIYAASAGDAYAAVLRRVRDRGRTGRSYRDGQSDEDSPTLAYFEWCSPPMEEICDLGAACDHSLTTPGCGCDKREYVQMANPALGRRITWRAIRTDREEMPVAEYIRERMGQWDDPIEGTPVIDFDKWIAAADLASEVADRNQVAFSIDVAPRAAAAAIGMAGLRADGRRHVQVLDYDKGTAWAVRRLVELVTRWKPLVTVIDESGPAGILLQDLIDAGFHIVKTPNDPVPSGKHGLYLCAGREHAQAVGAFVAELVQDGLSHLDQDSLNRAVEGATSRPMGDAYLLDRRDSDVDISPLVAVELARQGSITFLRETKKGTWAFTDDDLDALEAEMAADGTLDSWDDE